MQVKERATITALTFEEFVAYGRSVTPPEWLVDGVPWSFAYQGAAVTHENDDLYLVTAEHGGNLRFARGQVLLHRLDARGSQIRVLSAEAFAAEYQEDAPAVHSLIPRTVPEAVRSIDFRITAPHLRDFYRFAVPVVARALREIAEGLEADENRPWGDKDAPPPSGWSELSGTKVLDYTPAGVSTDHYRDITVAWAVAEQDFGESEPDEDVLDRRAPSDEELASLEPAERAALAWVIWREPATGWHAESPDGAHKTIIGAPSLSLDDACFQIVANLRNWGAIAEDEKISFIFKDQA